MSLTEVPTGILTFLIADVRGYTSFTQSHGDEGAARLADKFAEIAREGVEMYGGEVTELRGDEALAVFSSPRAAVRAAVDLQTVFADETVIDPTLPLTVGIGIDAGEAVAVQGGYRGGALNLAARLCSRAAAGEVLVSQGIAHLTRSVDGIELEQTGEAEVKGLSEPVQVFRARADRQPLTAPTSPGELPTALDAVTPMVGREPETRRLRWWWRLARRGAPTVVAVQGPAGIGKTRLVAELAATVAGGGGRCHYVSLVEPLPDLDAMLTVDDRPQLLVVDDIDVATDEQLESLTSGLPAVLTGPRLVVLVLDDESASSDQLTTVRRLAGDDDHVVRPRPLALEDMLRVAALYVGSAADALPHDLLTATGGVPRRVHEEISAWAHAHASRRLGALATAAASGRSDLRSVESDLAGTVIDLQMVREQATLFGLGPGRRGPAPDASPYRGLASFDVADAEVFFGRESLVAGLVSRLAGANLLGVVGASGSGKSSAVRAGLLPALAAGVLPGSEAWLVALLRPGEHPARALDRALWSSLPRAVTERLGDGDAELETVRAALADDQRLVVVVDQFEEVFTLCRDDGEREHFLAVLAQAAADPDSRIVVVLSIRADYYGRCAADPTLAELLAANHVLVGPMTAEEYRRAIVQPALRVGVNIEPELVDDLVTEVLGEPGALPLLSTTLLELWDHRDGRTMRRASSLASGGVHGAVARLADDVYDGFDEQQQGIARGVLLRLAGPGIGDSVVRRRVPLSEFDAGSDEAVRQVLDVLADRRLVTVSDGAVEVAHEALLREWPRLQLWLEEDREGRRLRGHLAVAAQEWVSRDHDTAELYRGARLSAALDWTTHHTAELNEVEREFIKQSRTANQAELLRQQRQNRRLRGLLVGVVGVLVLALVAGGVALVQRHSATRAARVALARQLGAEAVSAPRIDQAMLLAREAVLLDNSPATAGTLLATLLRDPAVRGTFTMPIQFRPLELALSPDGQTLAVRDNSSRVRFFDTTTHQQSTKLLSGVIQGPLYVGDHIVAITSTGLARPNISVFDRSTLHRESQLLISTVWLTQPTNENEPLFASADGRRIYFLYSTVDGNTFADKRAYVESWDIATGKHRVARLPGAGLVAATSLPGGDLRVVTDGAALTVDGMTLKTMSRTPMSFPSGSLGAMSADGRTIAFVDAGPSSARTTFTLVDLADGRRTPAAGAHTAPIQRLTFTPAGHTLVTVADDGNADVWDATTGTLQETLSGHSGRVIGTVISGDGSTLYTAGLDGAIFTWDLGAASRFGRPLRVAAGPVAVPGQKPALAVAPDSASFAVRTGPGRIGLISIRSLKPTATATMGHGFDVQSLAWSRRGVLAVGRTTSGVELWNPTGTPRLIRTLTGLDGAVRSVAFSSDGQLVAAATEVPSTARDQHPPFGWLGIWDVTSGRLLGKHRLGSLAWSVAMSPDGRRVVAGLDDGRIVVTTSRAAPVRTIDDAPLASPGIVTTTFTADGRLVTGAWSGIVQHWDVNTGKQIGRSVLTEPAPVSGLVLSPDGSHFVVTGGSSGSVKIWDDTSLQQFGASFPGGQGQWGTVAYTPDGSSIIALYTDGSAAVWPVTVSAWMQHACAVAGRNFTREEWDRFVPGHGYASTCPGHGAG